MPVDPPMHSAPGTATGRIVPTVALLSFVAGSMDAIASSKWGEVFTSAMSGNTVLLGIVAAQGNFTGAMRVLAAILGYVGRSRIAAVRTLHPRWFEGRDRAVHRCVRGLVGALIGDAIATHALSIAAVVPLAAIVTPVLSGLHCACTSPA